MERKALFFDVDGTLLSEKTKKVPESAVCAILEARQKGHLVFINSGRVYSHLSQIRKLVDVDGYLCGCGTYVRGGDKILYSYKMPQDVGIEIKDTVDRFDVVAVLEAEEGCYMQDLPDKNELVSNFRVGLRKDGVLLDKSWKENDYRFSKMCIFLDKEADKEGFIEALQPHMQVIDRGRQFYEFVPHGHTKATAIELVLDAYGIDKKHAYVFGDSMNDLPMFQYADHAVLMGEHDIELEEYASFITKSVEEDGVAFAMKELGII